MRVSHWQLPHSETQPTDARKEPSNSQKTPQKKQTDFSRVIEGTFPSDILARRSKNQPDIGRFNQPASGNYQITGPRLPLNQMKAINLRLGFILYAKIGSSKSFLKLQVSLRAPVCLSVIKPRFESAAFFHLHSRSSGILPPGRG